MLPEVPKLDARLADLAGKVLRDRLKYVGSLARGLTFTQIYSFSNLLCRPFNNLNLKPKVAMINAMPTSLDSEPKLLDQKESMNGANYNLEGSLTSD